MTKCPGIGSKHGSTNHSRNLPFWRTGARLFLAACLASQSPISSLGAAEKAQPGSDAEAPGRKEKSVEAIAVSAREAIVVVSHFGREGREDGVGAGFVVSSDGLIATCLHVIGEARPISVRLANGKQFEVTEVRAWDRKLDLAVIRIEATNLVALPLGDSDALKQGASVVALGNPLGLERSIVQGVVSAKRDFDGVEMIQLAIPIEEGNSGGPLLDRLGRVHGILSLKSLMSPNLGFATPVNALKPLLEKPNPVAMNRWLTIGALNPKEWTPAMGARWTQRSGHIQVEGLGSGFGGRSLCLSNKKVPDRPYELGVAVRLDDESGAAGLAFEADGDQRHYGFYPTAGQLRLTRFDGPTVYSWNILTQAQSSAYRPGEWNALKVRVEDEVIRCFVNGQAVFEIADAKLKAGKVGLAKFRNTKAAFRNFQLASSLLASEVGPPGEFVAALTNRLQNFAGPADADFLSVLERHPRASQEIVSERARKLEREAAQLRDLAAQVHRQSVQTELVKVLTAPEPEIDLFHAALLVAKLDNSDLEIQVYLRQLDEMAGEIKARLTEKSDDSAKLAALTEYLFVENGFHGSRTDYYNRANSYVSDVLDNREGLPITLSVLFLELARRIGLENVAGVALPRHFVVKHTARDGTEQLIDVFDGGKPFSRDQANELVRASSRRPLNDQDLKPAGKREIIVRMVRNLSGIAQRDESGADSLRYLDIIVALSPEAPMERLDRALLRLRNGDATGAKQDLKWILEKEPPGIDLERITELYHSLDAPASRPSKF